MSGLENAILDIYDDVKLNETMAKIASAIPRDLRSVEIPTYEEIQELEDSDFALSIFTKTAQKFNKYPVNDRLNTLLSDKYFDMNHGKLCKEAQEIAATYINKACEKFKVEPSEAVKTAASKFPTRTNIYLEKHNDSPAGRLYSEKTASTEKSPYYYALVKTAGDKTTNRTYAMPDAEHVKKASAYFDNFVKQFSPEDRHQYAVNVLKRSVELGVPVESENIEKYAGLSYNSNVDGYLSIRKKLVEDQPAFVEALDKLASFQGKEDPKTFAKVLHEFDKKAGLEKYYDRYLADPYQSTFGVAIDKTASVIYEKDGMEVTEADLKKVASDQYALLKNYFGSTLADGIKKEGSAAFMALPDNAKEVIAGIVNGEIQ